jgi:predicted dehydrogenase
VRYGAPIFSSIEELLASETSASVDGVLVCTSHHAHAHIGMAALRAGKHVLMEKPMVTDVASANALLAAAEAAAPLAFMVNNTANWQPQVRLAAEAVAGGRIGDVEHVMCCMHSPLLWLFDDPSNEGWTAPTGGMAGNGFGWGQLSHLLAWVFEVTKLEPTQAFATMTHSAHSGADMTDAAVIRCVTRDGKPASISLSGAATVPGSAHADDPAHSVGKRIEVSPPRLPYPCISLSVSRSRVSKTGADLWHKRHAFLRRRRSESRVRAARAEDPAGRGEVLARRI